MAAIDDSVELVDPVPTKSPLASRLMTSGGIETRADYRLVGSCLLFLRSACREPIALRRGEEGECIMVRLNKECATCLTGFGVSFPRLPVLPPRQRNPADAASAHNLRYWKIASLRRGWSSTPLPTMARPVPCGKSSPMQRLVPQSPSIPMSFHKRPEPRSLSIRSAVPSRSRRTT